MPRSEAYRLKAWWTRGRLRLVLPASVVKKLGLTASKKVRVATPIAVPRPATLLRKYTSSYLAGRQFYRHRGTEAAHGSHRGHCHGRPGFAHRLHDAAVDCAIPSMLSARLSNPRGSGYLTPRLGWLLFWRVLLFFLFTFRVGYFRRLTRLVQIDLGTILVRRHRLHDAVAGLAADEADRAVGHDRVALAWPAWPLCWIGF